MALDASSISEIVAAVSSVIAAGGLGGVVHTKKKSSKLGERIAKLEAYHDNTKQFIKDVKNDIKEIKQFLMERK